MVPLLLVIGSCSSVCGAPEWGGVEGSFITWGAGARALGLGRAYVAAANDASAASWNPAGLARVEQAEFSGLSALMWEGAMYHYVAAAFPTLTDGTFAFNGAMLTVGGFERRDEENEVVGGAFGITKSALSLGYGRALVGNVHIGVTMKYLGRWSEGWHSGFVSGDLGGLWEAAPGVSLGLAVKNLASWRYGTADELARQVNGGLALQLLDGMVMLAADVEQTGRWKVGGEVKPMAPVALRLGTGEWESSAGVGFQWQDTLLDYSGSLHRELGLSHRVSLTVRWGEPVSLTRLKLSHGAFDEAYRAYEAGDIEKAKRLSDQVLALDPNHPVAGYLMQKISQK